MIYLSFSLIPQYVHIKKRINRENGKRFVSEREILLCDYNLISTFCVALGTSLTIFLSLYRYMSFSKAVIKYCLNERYRRIIISRHALTWRRVIRTKWTLIKCDGSWIVYKQHIILTNNSDFWQDTAHDS